MQSTVRSSTKLTPVLLLFVTDFIIEGLEGSFKTMDDYYLNQHQIAQEVAAFPPSLHLEGGEGTCTR